MFPKLNTKVNKFPVKYQPGSHHIVLPSKHEFMLSLFVAILDWMERQRKFLMHWCILLNAAECCIRVCVCVYLITEMHSFIPKTF